MEMGKPLTVRVVDYHEVDRLVNDTYGGTFEFLSAQESSNDVDHLFHVDGKLDADDEDEVAEVKVIREGGSQIDSFGAQLWLDVLCADGHITAGAYLVEVCW